MRIYLEYRDAVNDLTGSGHLYLVLPDENEFSQSGAKVIRGGPVGALGPLAIETGDFAVSADQYGTIYDEPIDEFSVPRPETREDRYALDITSEILPGPDPTAKEHQR